MNKLLSTILSAVLLMDGLCQSSCSDNDDIKLTGIDGRPSVLLSNGLVTASFIYSGNQFAGIQYPDGQATHFSYEEGELWLTDMPGYILTKSGTKPTKSAVEVNRQWT